ncbi:hypothetical protein ABZX30_25740 [Streptomyces sp. NPDC004542]|uniref:Rv1733c family protein n=1 Tax=Streptomyces sp. NPDC004542 TaxID=3154281 RepID=UPI0033A6CEB2
MDRLERRLRTLLAVLAVVALPLAAVSAGYATYSHSAQARQARVARLHPVSAHLLSDARSSDDRAGAQSGFHALVRWSDREGGHTALAPVRAWLHRGATATVWLDGRGVVSAPPPGRDLPVTTGVAVGFGTASGGAAAALGVWWAVGRSFDHRRSARWAREWERVEPLWAARRDR